MRHDRTEQITKIAGGGLEARYILNQFHFHWSDEFHHGSEHAVNEARYPLEVRALIYQSNNNFSFILFISERV